jgi:predicted Zn-dependent peptidase
MRRGGASMSFGGAVERLDTEILRTEVDGVPVYWAAEAPGPLRAAIMFRAGRADETLAGSGKTHLVEHLALFGIDLRRSQFGGFVDPTRTVFHVSGTSEEVETFLQRVSAALSELPLERVELEKRVLRMEARSSGGSSAQTLMGLRFGAAGYGLVDYDELGLRRVDAQEVADWAHERFTSANAAVWLSGPPPSSLELRLPPGHRIPTPEPASLPLLELPAQATQRGGGVTASFVGSRSTALTTAVGLLEERLHRRLRLEAGLTYHVSGTYSALSGAAAHVTLGADCLDEHAAVVRDGILSELERLSADGPDTDELAAIVRERRAALNEPSWVLAELDSAATNELVGAPSFLRGDLVRELEGLTPQSVAEAVGQILPTALVLAPEGIGLQPGFVHFGSWRVRSLQEGRGYKLRSPWFLPPPRASHFILSPEGVAAPADKRGPALAVRFADVVAVLRLGRTKLQLIDIEGSWIQCDHAILVDGNEIRDTIEAALPAEVFIPFVEGEPGVDVLDLSREKIGLRTGVATEIAAVQPLLAPGERVLNLARAERAIQRGLLVLTDRRLLYLSTGLTGVGSHIEEFDLDEITRVRRPGPPPFFRQIVFKCAGKHTKFGLTPAARAPEFCRALRAHMEDRPDRDETDHS